MIGQRGGMHELPDCHMQVNRSSLGCAESSSPMSRPQIHLRVYSKPKLQAQLTAMHMIHRLYSALRPGPGSGVSAVLGYASLKTAALKSFWDQQSVPCSGCNHALAPILLYFYCGHCYNNRLILAGTIVAMLHDPCWIFQSSGLGQASWDIDWLMHRLYLNYCKAEKALHIARLIWRLWIIDRS